ncbi:MAG: hypothetical protein JNN08_12055 [Bryobacterales bacterium]|nr:hypothetical protein [Bryobacterales bacterium]
MAFHDDLLQQAHHLARLDRRRPKQASLRRAVSAAYYALFHYLIAEAVACWRIEEQRDTLARVFEHGKMKNACINCRSTNADVRAVASAFVELQSARHRADYNNAVQWTRIDTIEMIDVAERAFQHWGRARGHREAQDFLLSLLTDRK